MWALIEKATNTILRVSDEGVELSELKPFYWIACPINCTTSWIFDGVNFTEAVA